MARKTSTEPTVRQKQVLETLRQLTLERGFAPTRAELAAALGVKKASVQGVLKRLRAKGFLDWQSNTSRSSKISGETPQSQQIIQILQRLGALEQKMIVITQALHR